MDGLLLDSERLARDAFITACTEHGWAVDLDVYHQCIGSTAEGTEQILREHLGEKFPYQAVDTSWNRHYHARLAKSPVPKKSGALELLQYLVEVKVPRALATSTKRATAERKLYDSGLLDFFEHRVCGGETRRGKPYPEPYQAAAARLQLEPQQCLALEDSANGVRSAHAAGCVVIQIPDLVPPGTELGELDHLILESLTDVLWMLKKK
jgi:HAD superfamily hydrolase (TIGR01509 family)